MLVDLPYLPGEDAFVAAMRGLGDDGWYVPQPVRVAAGVYEVHINFEHTLRANNKLVTEYPYDPMFDPAFEDRFTDDAVENAFVAAIMDETRPHDYGVCDNWQQIVRRWPRIVSDDKRLVIGLSLIERDAQPAQGGWRWHKWGEYIGDLDPQYEYLADEPDIEQVYCFSLYEVKL